MQSIDLRGSTRYLSALMVFLSLTFVSIAGHASTNLALGKKTTSSSRESASMDAGNAVDGNMASRWASTYQDNNWIAIDLGAVYALSGVTLHWEGAYARHYQIQVSNDGNSWTTVRTVTNGRGGVDSLDIDATARHVRMNGIERGTRFGYSLWEFEVRGGSVNTSSDSIAAGKPATSSNAQSGHSASNAFDGSLTTRWSSSYSDNNWIAVDLGDNYHVSEVTLRWEAAYGRGYQIQVSDDGERWTTLRTVTDGNGGVDTLSVDGTGRYVRMNGQRRGTQWGYSLWEFEVKGTPAKVSNSKNIAQGKTVTASSREGANRSEQAVTDGDMKSRWASRATDDQWIAIDLGELYSLSGVTLHWEAAYGRVYNIQVSVDGTNWSTVHRETNGKGGVDQINLKGVGRYVRMQGEQRGTSWGYSLWEFEVHGTAFTPAQVNLAQSKPVSASSSESQQMHARNAVDGDLTTRWASNRTDNQWLDVDLGATYNLTSVRLHWEAAYGKDYQIRVSDDGRNWRTVHTTVNGNGGVDNIGLNATARHVRMQGLVRGTSWGYSLWQMEVFGYDPLDPDSDGEGSNPGSGEDSGGDSGNSGGSTDPNKPPVGGDVTAPTVPGSFRASEVSQNQIKLSWNASSDDVGVTSYAIYRDNSRVATVSASTRTYTDSGLRAGTTYRYTIRAGDAAGNWSSASSTLVLTTTSTPDPAIGLTLEWTPPSARENGKYLELSEIGGYEIRYRRANESRFQTMTVGPRVTRHTFTDLLGDYEFEIAAFDTEGLYSKFVTIRSR